MALIVDKIRENKFRLRWFGHVMKRRYSVAGRMTMEGTWQG